MRNAQKMNRRNRNNRDQLTTLRQLEKLPWTQAVVDVPVGHAIQYRDIDTGDVVYWHIRQSSVQKTMKLNADGVPSKVRQAFFDKVNLGRLFVTHTP